MTKQEIQVWAIQATAQIQATTESMYCLGRIERHSATYYSEQVSEFGRADGFGYLYGIWFDFEN